MKVSLLDSNACYLLATGSVTLDELMTGLMSAHETFQQAMDVEIREEVRATAVLILAALCMLHHAHSALTSSTFPTRRIM